MGYKWVFKKAKMRLATLENGFRKTQWVSNGL